MLERGNRPRSRYPRGAFGIGDAFTQGSVLGRWGHDQCSEPGLAGHIWIDRFSPPAIQSRPNRAPDENEVMDPKPTERISVEEQKRLAPCRPLRAGELLAGRYRIHSEAGRGATGVVHRATDTAIGREVALKVCSSPDAALLGRLRLEADSLRRITHPGLARVHEIFEVEGLACVVSDFIEGETLARCVDREAGLDRIEALDLFIELLDVLAAIHGAGLVHRDVKPANILLRRQPLTSGDGKHRLVLVDLGLARVEGEEASLTRTGELIGTPAYMAPEQVQDPKGVDHRADLYAAAAVLFFMVEGRPPFAGGTAYEIWRRHQISSPPRLVRGTPVERLQLGKLIARGLAKRPAGRWKAAREAREHAVEARKAIRRAGSLVQRAALIRVDLIGRPAAFVADLVPAPLGLGVALSALAGAAWLVTVAFSAGAPVATAVVRENALVALDAEGSELWRFSPPGVLDPNYIEDPESGLVIIEDLDADGREEVFFGATQTDPSAIPSRFYRLDRRGKVEWEMKAGRPIQWSEGALGDVFRAFRMILPQVRDLAPRLLIQISRSVRFSPTQIRAVSPDGTILGEWWNHGQIGHVWTSDFDLYIGDELIVGGYHNSHDGGPNMPALAILDPLHLDGASPPPPGERSVFKDLPPGSQLAYLIFPPNEIYRETGGSLPVEGIEAAGNDRIRVLVGHDRCSVNYEFGRDLTLVRAFEADACREAHVALEREGRLDHAYHRGDAALTPAPLYFDGSDWSTTAAWSRPLTAEGSRSLPVGPRTERR